MGNQSFYGPSKIVDTTKPMTVVVSTLTAVLVWYSLVTSSPDSIHHLR